MNAFRRILPFVLACAMGIMTGSALGVTTRYVDWKQSDDSGNGESWANAKKTLTAAIASAGTGDTILVCGSDNRQSDPSEGRYNLTSYEDTYLIDGLTIVGGFDPDDDTADGIEDADPETFETVLSGKFDVNSHAEHVVTATASAYMFGFIIEEGNAKGVYASDDGGGILIDGGDVEFESCIIQNNAAGGWGAGIAILSGDATIMACTIRNNSAGDWGGGIYVQYAEPWIYNCTIRDNEAPRGGGLAIEGAADSVAYVGSCLFEGNLASNRGGGLYVFDASSYIDNW